MCYNRENRYIMRSKYVYGVCNESGSCRVKRTACGRSGALSACGYHRDCFRRSRRSGYLCPGICTGARTFAYRVPPGLFPLRTQCALAPQPSDCRLCRPGTPFLGRFFPWHPSCAEPLPLPLQTASVVFPCGAGASEERIENSEEFRCACGTDLKKSSPKRRLSTQKAAGNPAAFGLWRCPAH